MSDKQCAPIFVEAFGLYEKHIVWGQLAHINDFFVAIICQKLEEKPIVKNVFHLTPWSCKSLKNMLLYQFLEFCRGSFHYSFELHSWVVLPDKISAFPCSPFILRDVVSFICKIFYFNCCNLEHASFFKKLCAKAWKHSAPCFKCNLFECL